MLLRHFVPEKMLRIMKISFLACFIFSLSLSANVDSQSKVSLKSANSTLAEVFEQIKAQTGMEIIYSNEELDDARIVSVQVEDELVNNVMESLLKGTNMMVTKIEDYYIIKPSKDSEQAQKLDVVSGVVLDDQGNPIPGVNIVVKENMTGTITDADGKFSMNIASGISTMSFSFIGFKTQEVQVEGTQTLSITLMPEISDLGEVVVTGYGTVEKRKLSSSIASIKGKDVVELTNGSVDRMLQGKVSGLMVINNSSAPGATPKIRIRGTSSISGSREPVWVIDGVILEDPVNISTEELNSLDNVNFIGNAISSLNPEDIERIDVLKDASATAIYGTKAANGVIVITTKKGKPGTSVVRYSNSFTTTLAPTYDDVNLMNSKQRVEVSEEMQQRGLSFDTSTPMRVGYEGLVNQLYNKEIDYDTFRSEVKRIKELNTDWYDLLFRNALSQKHTVSMSGGTDKTNYYVSLGYNNDKSSVKGVERQQLNTLLKYNFNLSDKIKLNTQLRASTMEHDMMHTSVGVYDYAFNTSRAIDSNSRYAVSSGLNDNYLTYNIFDEIKNTSRTLNQKAINAQFNFLWDINKNLRFSSLYNGDYSITSDENIANEKSYYAASRRGLEYGERIDKSNTYLLERSSMPYGGERINDESTKTAWLVRNHLTFNKRFNKHELAVGAGNEIRSVNYTSINTKQRGYLHDKGMRSVDINPTIFTGYANWMSKNPNRYRDQTNNYLSFYSTATYAFDNRYSFNFNFRTDGSNKFGQDDSTKFLPVWSASVRWNLCQEKFMQAQNLLDNLSLRLSYGIQGNVHPDQTPELIAKLGDMNSISQEFYTTVHKLPNTKLRWEKTKNYDIGLDFSILNNRIYGTFDYYKKRGEDQIIHKNIPYENGDESVALNRGVLENTGYDLSINVVPVKTDNWTWNISWNTSKNKTKLKEIGDNINTYQNYLTGSVLVNGRSVNEIYSYKFLGLGEDGLPNYEDLSEFQPKNAQEVYDRVFVASGNRLPDVSGGFSTSVRHKNLTLSCLFSYSLGSVLRLPPLYNEGFSNLPNPQQNMSSDYVNRWQQKGDEQHTNIPVLSDKYLGVDKIKLNEASQSGDDVKVTYASTLYEMYDYSDMRVVSGDYLRLRNVVLTYDFSSKLCEKLRVGSIRLQVSGNNLFVIKDKDLRGRDPEQITSGYGALPPLKSFSAGLNVSF